MTARWQRTPRRRPFLVELHLGDQHQPVAVGAERAQLGRELRRQHGNRAVGEVDAGAALRRLAVERRVGLHVVGDVGDRHPQRAAAARPFLETDRVVEVARRLAVDGDERHVAQIGAAVQILGARVGGQALGFRLHLRRKLDAEAVLAGDGEELHLGIVAGSEHLLEHAAHAAAAGRRRREAHARDQARVRGLRLRRADDLDDRQPVVERHRHPALAMALERADELGVLALDHRGHAAGRALARDDRGARSRPARDRRAAPRPPCPTG